MHCLQNVKLGYYKFATKTLGTILEARLDQNNVQMEKEQSQSGTCWAIASAKIAWWRCSALRPGLSSSIAMDKPMDEAARLPRCPAPGQTALRSSSTNISRRSIGLLQSRCQRPCTSMVWMRQ
jgi:hypothetical protein